MMTVFSFADRRTRLGSLTLDVLVSEEIQLEGSVTRYPVEDGTTISDHISQGPETLRITGMVSTADVAAFSFSSGGQYKVVDAVDQMRAMHKARALVTVSTGQLRYTDMAFTNLKAVRSNGDKGGNWLEITAELIKVRKVRLRTAEVPEAPVRGPARGRAGQTNTPAGRSSSASAAGSAPVNQSVFRATVGSGQAGLDALKGAFDRAAAYFAR